MQKTETRTELTRRLARRVFAFCLVPSALTVTTPSIANADLLWLASGGVMSVESCRFDGDSAVLVLRDGGEARVGRSTILEVLPDEVPRLKQVAPAPLVQEAATRWTEPALVALVGRLATRHGVDVKLAQAVVRVESNYLPDAVSPKGAKGLMQLMPEVVQQFGVDNPFDPEKNLDAGLRYLKGLLGRFTISTALAAYNAGEATVSRYGGIPPFRETQDYVQRIMRMIRR